MFATMRNPAAAYGKVQTEVRAHTADPHKLILMLYEGARMAVASAALHHAQGKTDAMSKSISHAIDIIANGLKASLDYKAGGQLAENLAALYDYLCFRLRSTNMHGDQAVFTEVQNLLKDLNGAWEEIAKKPAAHSANHAVA